MIVAPFGLEQVAEQKVAINAEHAVTDQKRLLTSEAVSETQSQYQMNQQLHFIIEIQKPMYRRNYTPQRSELATAWLHCKGIHVGENESSSEHTSTRK